MAVRDGAWADGEPLEKSWWWGWGSSPLQDLIAGLGDKGPDGAAVLGLLLASSADTVREQAAAATIVVVRAERQARTLLVPILESALSGTVGAGALTRRRALSRWARPLARPPTPPGRRGARPPRPHSVPRPASTIRAGPPSPPTVSTNGTDVPGALEILHRGRVPFDADVMDAITTTGSGRLAPPSASTCRPIGVRSPHPPSLSCGRCWTPTYVRGALERPPPRSARPPPPVLRICAMCSTGRRSSTRAAASASRTSPNASPSCASAGIPARPSTRPGPRWRQLRGRSSGGFYDLPPR